MDISKLSRNETNLLGIGTVLIFKKGSHTDSYIISWDSLDETFLLISLSSFHVVDKWESMELATESLTIERNGFVISDVIPYKELEMRRVARYEDWQSQN